MSSLEHLPTDQLKVTSVDLYYRQVLTSALSTECNTGSFDIHRQYGYLKKIDSHLKFHMVFFMCIF